MTAGLVLFLAGCGGSPGAVVRTAPGESAAGSGPDTVSTSIPGAQLDLLPDGGLGFDANELSEASISSGPSTGAAAGAVAAAEAMLPGFIEALANNDLDRAATLTTGEANRFLYYLVGAEACGASILDARFSSVSSQAELVGIGRLAVPASASVTIDGGVTRDLTAVAMEQVSNGTWLISDLVVDGRTADELSIDLDSTVRADLRLTPTEMCAGPDTVFGRFEVFNEGRDPIVVKDLYYLDSNGNRYEVEGTDPMANGPVPGRSTNAVKWEWTVSVENGLDGGQFVLVAADLDESRQENTEVLVTREYPVLPSPFFSDFDVDAAEIARALGGVDTDATVETSTGPDQASSP